MDLDDMEPRLPKDNAQSIPRPLDDLTVAELEGYITMLEGEIARARTKIQSKGGAKATADSFFKR